MKVLERRSNHLRTPCGHAKSAVLMGSFHAFGKQRTLERLFANDFSMQFALEGVDGREMIL